MLNYVITKVNCNSYVTPLLQSCKLIYLFLIDKDHKNAIINNTLVKTQEVI